MDISPIVVKPDEGRSVALGGMGVVFKLSGADTGGAFAVVEHPIEPGRLVLPHVHQHEDEYSYVLEGTIGARVGDHEVAAAGPGSYLLKPRGLMHTFWNAGPTFKERLSDYPQVPRSRSWVSRTLSAPTGSGLRGRPDCRWTSPKR